METPVLEGVLEVLWAEGEEGGGEAIDTSAADEQVDQAEQQDGQETDPDGEGQGYPDKPEGAGTGRNNPDAIPKHLAALKANPETAPIAKSLNDRLGKVRGYEQEFPTVKEAREVNQLLKSVGGREQVTAALESHGTLAEIDRELADGGTAIVDRIFKQSPDGALKLGGPILDAIAKANPQAYEKTIMPHAVRMMETAGLPGAINGLIDAFTSDNKAAMKDILSRIVGWYGGLQNGAKPQAEDPERTAFLKEKGDFERGKQEAAIKETFDSSLSYAATKIDAGLAADIKRLNLGPKAAEKLRQDVWHEIERRRNEDQNFTKAIKLKFDGKTPKKDAVDFLNSFTNDKLQDAIDEAVISRYGERPKPGGSKTGKIDPTAPKKGATQKPGSGGSATPGVLKVNGPPAREDIDYDNPGTDVFKGQAFSKSQKRIVKWR